MPPVATIHTSCHDQSGPIAATTCLRSVPFFATSIWIAPAPKFRPSRTIYVTSVNARMVYQISTMLFLRPMGNLTPDEEQKKQSEHEIQPAEPDQCKDRAP